VATAYIEYRHDRDKQRKWNSHMMSVIKEKLQASNVQNQNANVDEHSFGCRKGEADAVLMKEFALDNCMSEKSKTRHVNNEIYIHDLDSYAIGMHNCLSVPFDDLLAKGFNTRQTDVRPANSINTAFQLVAVIFQLQSLQQFGGVSATHLDWTMVPYIRKSFRKHWNNGAKYIGCYLKHFPHNWINVTEDLSIEDYPDYEPDPWEQYADSTDYVDDYTMAVYESIQDELKAEDEWLTTKREQGEILDEIEEDRLKDELAESDRIWASLGMLD
jgi:ribonucleoside-triphosphate reductase